MKKVGLKAQGSLLARSFDAAPAVIPKPVAPAQARTYDDRLVTSIAWVTYQRRLESMRLHCNMELVYFGPYLKKWYLKPGVYLLNLVLTLRYLLRRAPETVLVTVPPTPILYAVAAYCAMTSRRPRILLDCHFGTFDRLWFSLPLVRRIFNRADALIVHNRWERDHVVARYSDLPPVHVLEDPPADMRARGARWTSPLPGPYVLMPCSFFWDEPIRAVVEAARLCPEITFILSGDAANNRADHDLRDLPANCLHVGYLAVDEYNACLSGAAAVLGLTTQERIQLSCAGEAVAAEVPMVLADTETLRGLFYQGACYVDARAPRSIAEGCRRALRERQRLRKEVAALRREQAERWRKQMNRLQPLFFGS